MASEAVSYPHASETEQPKPTNVSLAAKLLTEFIGTFYLVLTISLNVGQRKVASSSMPPLAIGAMLACMIFMGGHISGAHYNPAVTLGVLLRGKIAPKLALQYSGTQFLAGLMGASCAYALTGYSPAPRPGDEYNWFHALVVEVIFTFALVSVVLNSATTRAQEDNSFYGFAIGFTVLVGAFCVGSISGAALNPSVGTGLILVDWFAGNGPVENIWIYWVGPFAGAVLSAVIFRITNPREYLLAELQGRAVVAGSFSFPVSPSGAMAANSAAHGVGRVPAKTGSPTSGHIQ